jgi:hypothetical protein
MHKYYVDEGLVRSLLLIKLCLTMAKGNFFISNLEASCTSRCRQFYRLLGCYYGVDVLEIWAQIERL